MKTELVRALGNDSGFKFSKQHLEQWSERGFPRAMRGEVT